MDSWKKKVGGDVTYCLLEGVHGHSGGLQQQQSTTCELNYSYLPAVLLVEITSGTRRERTTSSTGTTAVQVQNKYNHGAIVGTYFQLAFLRSPSCER